MHFYPRTMTTHASQLIQIYSVDWTDIFDTHNIEHRTEPVSHYNISWELILPQRYWLSIDNWVIANSNRDRQNQRDSNPRHSDVD